MKTCTLILGLLLSLVSSFAAQVKISDLPESVTPNADHTKIYFEIEDTGDPNYKSRFIRLSTLEANFSITPPGSSTYVIFNDGGAYGAHSGMTYDKTTGALTISGDLTIGGTWNIESAPSQVIVEDDINTHLKFETLMGGASLGPAWKSEANSFAEDQTFSKGLLLRGKVNSETYDLTSVTAVPVNLAPRFKKTLTAPTDLTFDDFNDGDGFALDITQDATGSRTLGVPQGKLKTETNQVLVTSLPISSLPNKMTTIYVSKVGSEIQYSMEGPDNMTLTEIASASRTANGIFFFEDSTVDIWKTSTRTISGLASSGTLTLPTGTTTLVGTDSSQTLTGKTIDTDGTDNVLKRWKSLFLGLPRRFDNSGAYPVTNDWTASLYGTVRFDDAADETANWVEYRGSVPYDIDTSTDLIVRAFHFRLGGAENGTHRYVMSMATVASSASATPSMGTSVNLDFAGDAGGANDDVETITDVTWTGSGAALTAKRYWVIRVARDGNASQDSSSVDSYFDNLEVIYKSTQ